MKNHSLRIIKNISSTLGVGKLRILQILKKVEMGELLLPKVTSELLLPSVTITTLLLPLETISMILLPTVTIIRNAYPN